MDVPVVKSGVRQGHLSASFNFAVLTPSGRGAISTIGLSGPASLVAMDGLFSPASGRPLSSYANGNAVYGRFRSTNTAREDVVVGLLAAGEIELHCHGGPAAVEAINQALAGAGGVQIDPAAWTHRQKEDATEADALLALTEGKTERAAAILLDQFRGALRRKLERVDGLLARGELDAAIRNIDELLDRADLGLHLTHPWKVVITGQPNVGKSSLTNAVLGYQRSIVWHEPGTTRDVLTAMTAIDGWWTELSDVAGLRKTDDPLEAAGVERAEQAVATADLVIFVADLTAAWPAELYQQICQHVSAREVARLPIIVHNKYDIAAPALCDRPNGVATSAITRIGVANLCQAISQSLVPMRLDPGTAVPFTQNHRHSLRAAAAALRANDISSARGQLQAISAAAGPTHS